MKFVFFDVLVENVTTFKEVLEKKGGVITCLYIDYVNDWYCHSFCLPCIRITFNSQWHFSTRVWSQFVGWWNSVREGSNEGWLILQKRVGFLLLRLIIKPSRAVNVFSFSPCHSVWRLVIKINRSNCSSSSFHDINFLSAWYDCRNFLWPLRKRV